MRDVKEDLLESVKLWYPHIVQDLVSCFVTNTYDLVVRLKNGQRKMYNDDDHFLRILSNDPDNMSKKEFSDEFMWRLIRMMSRKRITQEELAKRTGLTQSSISQYVRGKKLPNLYTLDKIARALNCSMDDFRDIDRAP